MKTKVLILTIKNTNPQEVVQKALIELERESWKLVSIDTKVSAGETYTGFTDGSPAVPLWVWYTITIVLTKD